MTVRQLHYTSTRHGRDGIEGFQVAAATAGITQRQEDEALPLSAYRPPPAAPPVPSADEVARFPVAFGYARREGYAVLFCSRYLGTDFTGRQGNYFAHVMVLDAPSSDLAGLQAAEAWGSAQWTSSQIPGTELPAGGAIQSGPLADRHTVRGHLLDRLLPGFESVLAAVRDALSGVTGKVVVVAADPDDVAIVLAAVSRSLPPALASAVSFVTYSASPADADLVVVGTTPDVTVPSGGARDRRIVDLDGPGSAAPDAGGPDYAAVLARCWSTAPSTVEAAVALAGRADPPLRADELDAFAGLADLAMGRPDLDTALRGLEFAVTRMPAALDHVLWQRLDDVAADHAAGGAGSLPDIARWSAALGTAAEHRQGPGPGLEAGYLASALSGIADDRLAPSDVWFPARSAGSDAATVSWAMAAVRERPTIDTVARVLDTLGRRGIELTDHDLQEVVDVALMQALFEPDDPSPASRLTDLPGATRLLELAGRMLEDRLGPGELYDHAVTHLAPGAAEVLVERAPRGGRCASAARLALARAGRTDRVQTLTAEVDRTASPAQLLRVADLIWSDLPTAAEGVDLCRAVDAATLAASGIPERLAQRLLVDARAGELRTVQERLAAGLRRDPAVYARLPSASADVVDAVWAVAEFRGRPRQSEKSRERAIDAAELAAAVEQALGDQVRDAVASWLVAQESSIFQSDVLEPAARGRGGPEFVAAYGRRLATMLATAEPPMIAIVLPAVVHLSTADRAGTRLLDTVCRDALSRRRSKDLDKVGMALEARKSKLMDLKPGTAADWPSWWSGWRDRNGLGRSTLRGMLRRLTPGGER